MIINTGQRTDIPAFFTPWFVNRLREGYVCVRNPYNPQQVTRYELNPNVVDLIGFCSKNPAPLLPYLSLLKDYGQFWYMTITPYGTDIEPSVPNKDQVMDTFCALSRAVGKERVGWRYDPIFISPRYSLEFHLSAFERMASRLSGYTDICVISFIDLYDKVRRNFPEVREVTKEERLILGKAFSDIARRYGFRIKACAEGRDLEQFGIDCDGCMTMSMYQDAIGCPLNAPKKPGARKECACYLSCDIGAYDTCMHFCRYCYANTSRQKVLKNRQLHDPKSPFLIGGPQPDDQLHLADQKSWKVPDSDFGQLSLF